MLQHQIDVMLPRVFRRAGEPGRPVGLIEVAEFLALRHFEPVVQQPHRAIRRLAVVAKAQPADQCLIGEHREVGVLGNRLAVVGGDERAVLAELDQAANDRGRRDLVQVCLLRRAAVRHGHCGGLHWGNRRAGRRRCSCGRRRGSWFRRAVALGVGRLPLQNFASGRRNARACRLCCHGLYLLLFAQLRTSSARCARSRRVGRISGGSSNRGVRETRHSGAP